MLSRTLQHHRAGTAPLRVFTSIRNSSSTSSPSSSTTTDIATPTPPTGSNPSVHERQSQPRVRTATEVADKSQLSKSVARALENTSAHIGGGAQRRRENRHEVSGGGGRGGDGGGKTASAGGGGGRLSELLTQRRKEQGTTYDADASAIAGISKTAAPKSNSGLSSGNSNKAVFRQRRTVAFQEGLEEESASAGGTIEGEARKPPVHRQRNPRQVNSTGTNSRNGSPGQQQQQRRTGAPPRSPRKSSSSFPPSSSSSPPEVSFGPPPTHVHSPILDLASLITSDLRSNATSLKARQRENAELQGDYTRYDVGPAVDVGNGVEFARRVWGRNTSVGLEGREKLVKVVQGLIKR